MSRVIAFGFWALFSTSIVVVANPQPTTTPQAAKEPTARHFPDVPKGHWADSAVSFLAASGVIEGGNLGRFNGDAPLTRYEFIVAVARLLEFDYILPRTNTATVDKPK